MVSEKLPSFPATRSYKYWVVKAKQHATAVKSIPRMIPLYWYAHGRVTVPHPMQAFQVLKMIVMELILEESFSYSRSFKF